MNEAYKLAGGFGGNYFMTSAGELYSVKRDGIAQKVSTEGILNLRDVMAFGGRYFMTNRGVVYTIADAIAYPESQANEHKEHEKQLGTKGTLWKKECDGQTKGNKSRDHSLHHARSPGRDEDPKVNNHPLANSEEIFFCIDRNYRT
jgi:hypothetical protein